MKRETKKYKAISLGNGEWFIRLKPGNELLEALSEFAQLTKKKFITIISGVGGGFEDVWGYFSQSEKKHGVKSVAKKLPKKMYELTAIGGNITWIKDNSGKLKPFVHAHANFSDDEFKTHGFHLTKAYSSKEKGLTGEITVKVSDVEVERVNEEESGLPLNFVSNESSIKNNSNKREMPWEIVIPLVLIIGILLITVIFLFTRNNKK